MGARKQIQITDERNNITNLCVGGWYNTFYRFISYFFVMWSIFITFVNSFDYNSCGTNTNRRFMEENT